MGQLKHIWCDSRCRRSQTGTHKSIATYSHDETDGMAKTWRDRRHVP